MKRILLILFVLISVCLYSQSTIGGYIDIDASGNITLPGNLVVIGSSEYYAEMYIYENAVESDIDAVNQWHPGISLTAGLLNGWTFDAGGSINILSFADYSGTVAGTIKVTTDGAHGYSTGNTVCLVGANIVIGGANEYAGVYIITVIDSDEYYFTNANWNATTTARSIRPSTLIAGANTDGDYTYKGTASMTSAANSKTYDFKMFVNATGSEKINARINAKNATEYSPVTGLGGFTTVSAGDVIWFGVMGITDASNITIRHANAFIEKL